MPNAPEIQKLFSKISQYYDGMNDLISLGQHRYWKKILVNIATSRQNQACLDLCTGTGDIAISLAKKQTAQVRIIGTDFCEEMLVVAKRRALKERLSHIEFLNADSTKLPFQDEGFSLVTISFGIRNIHVPELALKEIFRVLKPQGRFLCLEATQVSLPIVRYFSKIYVSYLVPFLAKILGRNVAAYSYLPLSIESFWSVSRMEKELKDIGFINVTKRSFLFGAATLYCAEKS